MQIILVTRRHGRSVHVPRWFGRFLPMALVLLTGLVFSLGYKLGRPTTDNAINPQVMTRWQEGLAEQEARLEAVDRSAQKDLAALTVRLSELQARVTRLDALGERLVDVADLDSDEFHFGSLPGVGGPLLGDPALQGTFAANAPAFNEELGRLEDSLISRRQQLSVIEDLLHNRQLENDVFVGGRPVRSGAWMSSRYGYRTDPFTGARSWHGGLDFAGPEGTEIVTVASGIVEFAGTNGGYGKAVDINHGNGYRTRYAHNRELLVETGDIVEKGQAIARLGSTGRSTAPHLHFEVHLNDRTLDPIDFITRRP